MEIKCKDCGEEFTIVPDEQKWYESRNLLLPKRCKHCRIARRKQINKGGFKNGEKI